MQTGFAMLCAGSVRQKNVKNTMLKHLLDSCGGALGFYAIGYGLAYGTSNVPWNHDEDDTRSIRFAGKDRFFILGVSNGYEMATWFFQFAFAASAATIVAGTVAERCKMVAYLTYSVFLTGIVYPIVVHSIWAQDGFLTAHGTGTKFRGIGVVDFAGSGVVHMTGGFTALIAAMILGPRRGRFYDEDGNPLDQPAIFPPHSVALQILGTFILWFGWYGFNPGSALMIASGSASSVAALSAITTTISAASGCVSGMFTDCMIETIRTGEVSYDLTMAMNGALSGLVAVTAGSSVINPWAAVIIGMIAGWVYYALSKLLIRVRIDDAVNAIPVHLGNGIWGILSVGLFADPVRAFVAYGHNDIQGLFYGSGSLLINQFVAVCWIIGWVGVTMIPFFTILRLLGMLRVNPLEEDVGLDISHHRGAAYDLSAPNPEDVEKLMEVLSSRHGKVEIPSDVYEAASRGTKIENTQ
jgi:ammonium transporter, Amt family